MNVEKQKKYRKKKGSRNGCPFAVYGIYMYKYCGNVALLFGKPGNDSCSQTGNNRSLILLRTRLPLLRTLLLRECQNERDDKDPKPLLLLQMCNDSVRLP